MKYSDLRPSLAIYETTNMSLQGLYIRSPALFFILCGRLLMQMGVNRSYRILWYRMRTGLGREVRRIAGLAGMF